MSGITNQALCASVGIRQPVTFYAWEKGASRPTVSHFDAYVQAIGADREEVLGRAHVAPSRLERVWEAQYKGSGRNNVRNQVRLSDLASEDLVWFSGRDDLQLTPEHYARNGIPRHLPVDEDLMGLLGFYLAEGSCSDRGGIRLAIGQSNRRFIKEMMEKFSRLFGLPAIGYSSNKNCGELKLVNRVAALVWQHVFGFASVDSLTKRIPDLLFNVSEPMRLAFLRGYLLGDGTVAKRLVAFATSSYDIASGLVYLPVPWASLPRRLKFSLMASSVRSMAVPAKPSMSTGLSASERGKICGVCNPFGKTIRAPSICTSY